VELRLALPAVQRLLARLSVFAGGWTAEAAEVVHGEGHALALLVQLVHKSLVVAEPRDGRTRYRLLETVRQFAAEKLEAMGEIEDMRRRHCDDFTALVEAFDPSMIGPRLKAWCHRVSDEWSNIRAAVDWARPQASGDVRLARIAGSLGQYLTKHGSGSEITAWLQEAIARTSAAEDLPRARALIALAGSRETTWLFADRPAERAMVEEALRLGQAANDATTIAYALMLSGGFQDMRAGTREDHLAPIEQSLRMYRQAGHVLGVGDALRNLALTYKNLDDELCAAKALEESALWCYETGETLTLFNSLNYLATFNASRAIRDSIRNAPNRSAHVRQRLTHVNAQDLAFGRVARRQVLLSVGRPGDAFDLQDIPGERGHIRRRANELQRGRSVQTRHNIAKRAVFIDPHEFACVRLRWRARFGALARPLTLRNRIESPLLVEFHVDNERRTGRQLLDGRRFRLFGLKCDHFAELRRMRQGAGLSDIHVVA
jgi:hypothetical protein